MNMTVLISMLATSVAAASPLLLAALGELVVERSGVLNLGIEGIMLVGALTAVAATLGSGSVVIGILCAIAAGMLLGLLFALLTVTIRADHVVAGLARVAGADRGVKGARIEACDPGRFQRHGAVSGQRA